MNHAISYSSLRENLKRILDKVCATRSPIFVQRRNGEDVVILSKDDFESLEETNYLLSSPKNASRLHEALERKSKDRIKLNNIKDLDL